MTDPKNQAITPDSDRLRVIALEAELKRERERFNIIFQNTTVSIWDYVFATRQIIQPTRSKELHGFDTVIENVPDSLIDSGYVHPDSVPAFRAVYDRLLAGSMHEEGVFRVRTADRTGYWYEHIRYNTLLDANGHAYAAVGLSTDVTEEMENRQTLTRWQELLSQTLGQRGGVIEFDLFGDALVGVENARRAQTGDWSGLKFDDYIAAYTQNYVYIGDVETVRGYLRRDRLLTDYLDGKREFTIEYRMQFGEQLHWVQLTAKFVRLTHAQDMHFFMLHTDITAQKEKELALQRRADSDAITGLLNHRAFTEQAQSVFAQFAGQPVLLVLDLDGFKDINDSFGHMTGDRMLTHAGRCITALLTECGESALSGRVGGDEFAVLFYDRSRGGAEQFARNLLERLAEPVMDGIRLYASIGIALAPADGRDYDELYLAADRALYHVKRHGKNGLCFYDSIWHEAKGTLLRRQQFLSDTIAGGMMGSYLEEDLPLYFIDERMLHWLGYESEAAFRQASGGSIPGCIHPEDRQFAVQAVWQQLQQSDRCEIDYRIRKQDGSYIWVHDIGEKTITPEGRTALTSVCRDITVQKEHADLIQRLVQDANGGIGLFRVEDDGRLTLMYASEDLSALGHYEPQEYEQHCARDAMDTVYEKDRPAVWDAMCKAITEDAATSLNYRIPLREGGFAWITGTFSKFGEDGGCPVLRAVFMPLPIQYELQLQTLNIDSIGVYVINLHTKEIYYANDASFRLHNVPLCSYAGKTCHELYYGRPAPCEHCILTQARQQPGEALLHTLGSRILSIEVQERLWNGAEVAIVYDRDVTDQVRAQESLQQSREMLETACAFADIGVFSYDVETKKARMSRKLQHEFDFPEYMEDFPDCILRAGPVLPEFHALYRSQMALLRGGTAEIMFEIRTMLNDGKAHWLRLKGKLLNERYAGHKLAVVSVQMIDSEKAVLARLALERQKQQTRDNTLLFYYIANVSANTLAEHKPDFHGIALTPMSGTLDDFATVGCAHLAFSPDAEAVRQLHRRERLLANFHKGLVQEEYKTQVLLPDGRILWTRHTMQLFQDPATQDILLYEYVYDINEEQIIDAMLKMEMSYGYEVIGNLFVSGDQFTYLEIGSESAAPVLRHAAFSDFVRQYAQTALYPEDRRTFIDHYTTELPRLAAEPQRFHAEMLYRTVAADGSIRYHKDDNYFYDKQKGVFLLTRRDYTDIVRAEEQEKLRLSDALARAEEAGRAKNEFLARMSHDMRTPMNVVIGLTSLTIDAAEDPVEVRANMTKLRTASEFLLGLVNDILDMAKIEDRSLSLNMGDYLYSDFLMNMRTTFLPQCEAKGIRLTMKKPVINPRIRCDKTRLNQIFYNLFSNAVKYTPPGGTVDYTVQNLQIGGGRLHVDYVIRDSGIGMSPAFQQHMFEPFTRENNAVTAELQGSGLGLSITKQLVELMGGTLRIDSAPGKGTTAIVSLSFDCLDENAAVQAPAPAPQLGAALQGKVVLLAEDHPINAEIAIRLLEKKGMTVLHAANGRLATEMFAASAVGGISAVLMDIRMPEMDGLAAAAAIRALDRPDAATVPILAMSANAYPEDVEKSLQAGMNAHLSKPMDTDTLYRTLESYLRD